ncbi:MAG TPA: sugar phosphate isomerase/epimerase family protein [Bryobacteraceae bacterium]|nr:sugar phosphate isomerase/epimerase family protein [Bryobacteraceae bacterium]
MAHEESSGISRRAVLAGAGLLAASAARSAAAPAGKLKVAIFSKHLQFVKGDELPRLAAEIGFDAIDITVRKGGHIEPDRVRQELPGLVASIRKHGLEVPMITTDITDTTTPYTEDILRTMADLGIHRYRWNNFRYVDNKPIIAQLQALRPAVAKLADLNKKYQVCAMYHTHSGVDLVGASFWDLHILMDGMDPNAVGVNFDIGHATVEGGLGGWINNFRVITDRLRGVAVKDFLWGKNAKGDWQPQWKPLGEGMVRFPKFFPMLAATGFDGPLQMHFEYNLGTPEQTKAYMKRDLATLRGYLAQANL